LSASLTLWCFPWNLDPEGDTTDQTRRYYERAYSAEKSASESKPASELTPLSAQEQYYVDYARAAANKAKVPERLADFIRTYGLKEKKVLEVGAGSGLLQDAVDDYTALDISPTAGRFFHKPLVEASATNMPFPDNSFDGLWSFWVLEHIPNPEKALLEMRRVVKPGGYMFLEPAFDVSEYAAQGYRVRPYRDFGLKGKLIKVTAAAAASVPFHYLQHHQVLALRYLGSRIGRGPSRLHFTRLTPNYDQYWEADSDGAISLSAYELYRWFITRGDKCLNCPSETQMVLHDVDIHTLIMQVIK